MGSRRLHQVPLLSSKNRKRWLQFTEAHQSAHQATFIQSSVVQSLDISIMATACPSSLHNWQQTTKWYQNIPHTWKALSRCVMSHSHWREKRALLEHFLVAKSLKVIQIFWTDSLVVQDISEHLISISVIELLNCLSMSWFICAPLLYNHGNLHCVCEKKKERKKIGHLSNFITLRKRFNVPSRVAYEKCQVKLCCD